MSSAKRALLAAALSLASPWLLRAEPSPAGPRKIVRSVDDLPRHTYRVPAPPSQLLSNDVLFARLAIAVQRDVDGDLRRYDIRDRTTLQRYKGTQLALALLSHRYALARELIAELRGLEEKPGLKLTTGLVAEAWIDADREHVATHASRPKVFQARLTALIRPLPWGLVQDEIKEIEAGYEIRSPALLIGLARQEFDPAEIKTGTISSDVAWQVVAMRNQIVNYLPLKAQVVAATAAAIAAHRAAVKPDLWTPSLVALPAGAGLAPVRIGIWDSGVDLSLFPGEGFTDEAGRHGIAYDLHSNPVPDLLYPLGPTRDRLPEIIGRLKGFLDLEAAVDTPEAAAVRRYMGSLQPDQVKPTLEDLDLVGNWAHGTHVAGIAVAGDPFARLVVGRLTFDYHLVPEKPTIEQARKDAAAAAATVDYFKRNGVRVVNMSWGGSLKDVEDALEANGAGGTAEERKELARRIFDIGRDGLRAALQGAPGILFVAAAGNGDNNVNFDEFIPSSFQLPNMITVGAVDQAGEETSFSSFGPTVNVHADGFEVESYIPGGRRLKLSGTSMAAPQVTNLAAKLFAIDPALTPEGAKELILAGCRRNGRVNLVDPARSVALLRARLRANGVPRTGS